MSLFSFLKLVEIQTKLASLFPFLIGALFVYYRYDTFNPFNTAIFFSAMLIFDLTTTAINNYMDYKKATSDKYRREKNIIGQAQIPEKIVVITILTMLAISTALSIWLVFRTDLLVLIIGMLCFAIGIFYTFGPVPLSRMPVGEVFSGITMGFGIVFLTVYVNAFDQGIANFLWEGRQISFHMDIIAVLEILIVSLPCIFTIANIMLANNICDLEDDIINKRFTLPFYIGKNYAVLLYNILNVSVYAAIIASVLLNFLPKLMLLSLITIVPVYQHMKKFTKKQDKAETFVLAIKNLVAVNGALTGLLMLAIIL